jgi:sigma-B regulation protein RsbU (phosphoserine phosphatase)
MRLTLRETSDLGRAVSRTSDFLEINNSQSMFATAFVATMDLETGMLTYCNAGHNPPFLLHADGRIERLLSAAGDPPLATWSPAEFTHAQRPLEPGDRIVLFTDGVTESHDAQHEEFGDERLLEVLRSEGGGDPAALARAVIAAVDAFVVNGPQFDDLTCVVATYGSKNGETIKIQSCRSQ